MLRCVLILVLFSLVSGCYYIQAAQGQLELTRKREPIEEVLQAEDTSPELAARLRLVQEARQFSIDELQLPDNESYHTYADIEREFVLWNVFAAAEFSLRPKTWCYPVAGCVAYRGYFAKNDAMRESEKLAGKGFDVFVGGVAAYSTLGKFNDPVVSSMMNWEDVQLVAVLFHELAHQVLYVKGDSEFNESFATAVEEIGMQRWLESRGMRDEFNAYVARRERRQVRMAAVATARDDLAALYALDIDDVAKRKQKQVRYRQLESQTGWTGAELNNARLVSMTLYEGQLPQFRALYEKCEQRIECFYDESRELAGR